MQDRVQAAGVMNRIHTGSEAPMPRDFPMRLEEAVFESRKTLEAINLFKAKLLGHGEEATNTICIGEFRSLVECLNNVPDEVVGYQYSIRESIGEIAALLRIDI